MKLVQILTSLTLLSIPAYVVRCRFFEFCEKLSPVPTTLLEILILATFTSWILWRVYLFKEKGISPFSSLQSLSRQNIIAVGVFLLAALISVFVSPNLVAASGIFKAYFVEAALFGFIVYDLASVKKSLDWLFPPLILSGVWVAFIAILQFLTGQFIWGEARAGEISSIYNSSNSVGLYLGPLFFLTVGLIVDRSLIGKVINKKSVFYGVSALILILAIIFSGSKGALVGVGVGLIFLSTYLVYRKSNRVFQETLNKIFLVILTVFFISNILFLYKISDYRADLSNQNYLNVLSSRFCLWETSKEIVADKPVFGIGLSSFEETSQSYQVCESGPAVYPHNIFLNFWLEIGFVGFASFLFIIYLMWVTLKRSKNVIAIGIMAAIIYMFIHGIVDVPYFKNDLSTQFWVFLAITAWIGSNRRG